MENSGFLKSVNFGGFDKKDVLAYVDDLNTKIYTLEAELEEAKSQVGEDGGAVSNFDGAKKYEEMLQKERAHVSELMAKNDTLTLTVQSHESAIADKDTEIESLKEKIADLENKVSTNPAVQEEASSFDIGSVFIEAKKSADKIIVEARNAAKKMDVDAKALAEQVVGEANQKAQSIVTTADSKAGKILSDAESKAAVLSKASDGMKERIIADIDNIFANVSKLSETIADFSNNSKSSLENARSIITDVQKNIKNDNIAAPKPNAAPIAAKTEPVKEIKIAKEVKEPKSEDVQHSHGKAPMSFDEMAEYAKSLQQQIEAEAISTEEM